MMFLQKHYRPVVGGVASAAAAGVAMLGYYLTVNSLRSELPDLEKIAENFQCCIVDYCNHKSYGNDAFCLLGHDSDTGEGYGIPFFCLNKLNDTTIDLLCATALAYVARPIDWFLVAGIMVGCGAVGTVVGYLLELRQQRLDEYEELPKGAPAASIQ